MAKTFGLRTLRVLVFNVFRLAGTLYRLFKIFISAVKNFACSIQKTFLMFRSKAARRARPYTSPPQHCCHINFSSLGT